MWDLKRLQADNFNKNIEQFYNEEKGIKIYMFVESNQVNIDGLSNYMGEFFVNNFDYLTQLDEFKSKEAFLKKILYFPAFIDILNYEENLFQDLFITCVAIKNKNLLAYNIGNGLVGYSKNNQEKILLRPQNLKNNPMEDIYVDFKYLRLDEEKIDMIILCNSDVSKLIYNDFFYNDFTIKAKKVLKKRNLEDFKKFLEYYNIKSDYCVFFIEKYKGGYKCYG